MIDLLAEVLSFFVPLRRDDDRSIVGESSLEEGVAQFWRRVGWMLLLAAGVAAFYVWVLKDRLAI